MSNRQGTSSASWGNWGGGLAIGIAIGLGIGVALDNIGAGIAIGVALGIAFGTAFDGGRRRREPGASPKSDGDAPSP